MERTKRRQLDLTTPDLAGTGVVISGVAEFGTPYAGNSAHRATYLDASDVVELMLGHHDLKIGGGIRHVDLSAIGADGHEGLYADGRNLAGRLRNPRAWGRRSSTSTSWTYN